jgi:predicted nucleic acid-binding Zn finger protein
VLWVVQGRRGEYQVIPESLFCTCDDYYFRVMANKKELCYHLVAQRIAEPLGKYQSFDLSDVRYTEISSRSNRASHPKS